MKIKWYIPTAIVMFLGYIVQTQLLLSPDVGYLLHATSQILSGGQYVTDIFETNPPLIFYLYIPAALFIKWTACSVTTSIRWYVFFLASISAGICWYLLKKLIKKEDGIYLSCLYFAVLMALFIVPLQAFAQREHLFIILFLPYLFASLIRLENKTISPIWALMIGMMAGAGIGLKPYFLAPLLLIELNFIFWKRTLFAWVRIETIVVFLVFLIYLASIWLFQRSYFNVILPFVFNYYFPFIKKTWIGLFSIRAVAFCIAMILSYFLISHTYYKNIAKIILLALIGMLVAFFMQRAGWYYHLYPAVALAFLMLAHFVGQSLSSVLFNPDWKSRITMVVMIVIVFIPLGYGYYLFTLVQGFERESPVRLVSQYILAQPGEHSVACYTAVGTSLCFPLIYETNSTYGQSFPSFWWYNGVLFSEMRTTQDMKQYHRITSDKNFLIQRMVDDLDRYHARWVIVDMLSFRRFTDEEFNVIDFFSENKQFRQAWQQYHYLTQIDRFRIYERMG